jgi:antitoxin (DNA-binding transcriptional repressor) of toxin-antitoxin stability system
MLKKIGTDDMRESMGRILDCVNLRGDEFIIERKHKPLAALVPVAKLEALSRFAKSFALEMISGPDTTIQDDEEIDFLANEAKHKSRKKTPQKKKRAKK